MSSALIPIRRRSWYRRFLFVGLFFLLIVLFLLNLKLGTVIYSWAELWKYFGQGENDARKLIISEIRVPSTLASLFAGAALAVGGLMMQTLFRNPLADPSILGVSSGAGLGVAILTLAGGRISGASLLTNGIYGQMGIIVAAFAGAIFIMSIIMAFALRMQSATRLLILGVMVGYLSFSAISFLKFFSLSEDLKYYVVWGLGSFSAVSTEQLSLMILLIVMGLIASYLLIKPLNTMWLGESVALSLGIPVRRVRLYIILASGFLTAVVTAFCGPIAFIGLAVPHLGRNLLATADHLQLILVSVLLGAILALFVNLISRLPIFGGALPINALTALIGAPVVIVFLWKWKNL